MVYMVTFTIPIPPMLAYIPAPWILWDIMHTVLESLEQLIFVMGLEIMGIDWLPKKLPSVTYLLLGSFIKHDGSISWE